MNKYRLLISCLALILVLTLLMSACAEPEPAPAPAPSPAPAPAPTPAPEKTTVMRCAAEFAPPEPISLVLKEMETVVPEATGGKVKFEYYPAAQLYTFSDAVMAMKAGDLEMGINGNPISFFVPEWDMMCNLLFLVEDNAHLQRIYDTDAYKDLCARMEANGIKPITRVYPMDDQPLFNNDRPIVKPEDLQGLKFSVGPGPTFLEAMTLLSGSKPINVPVAEVPSALETGMMDGSPFPWPVMTFMDLPRILPYVTLMPFGLSFPVGLVVSNKWWNDLSPDLQQTLQGIFEDTMAKYGEMVITVGDEQQKLYTENPDTTVTELTAEEMAVWKDTLKPLYDKLGQDPNLLSIIEAAEATRQ
jgi:TRAP-type C4-dicarboxylate transport system substrate-binding protein